MKPTTNFASDNNAGIHPAVLKAIAAANTGRAVGYGDDKHTKAAAAKFRRAFGPGAEALFVNNGTGANVVCLSALTKSFNSIFCSDVAHIFLDECNAVEKATGCKLIGLPAPDGKIRPEQIAPYLAANTGDVHRAQPKVISITQPTELGTVYAAAELKALADFAHSNGMYLHIDGARLSNAAAALGKSLRAAAAGADAISFGGTKNGLMIGEAAIFFDKTFAADAQFIRKQNLHLTSKMRFIAAQFDALLTDNLWLENARHANAMAALLAREVAKIPNVRITQKVETNAVFASVPAAAIPKIRKQFYFYVWDATESVVRWMTAFDTTEADVRHFAAAVKKAMK